MEIAQLQFITQDHPDLSHTEQAKRACEGGIRWVQVRLKKQNEQEALEIARQVQAVCRNYNATFIINDRVHLAKELDADGVHLGRTDMPVVEARVFLGKAAIIGGTANTEHELTQRFSEPLNYVGFGPYRFTATKENLSPVLGLHQMHQMFANVRQQSRIDLPVLAIGGISIGDIDEILEAGFHGIALSGAIVDAADPIATSAQFCSKFAKQKDRE